MSLRQTLSTAHTVLSNAGVDHALIGGFALAAKGITRATVDIVMLIHSDHMDTAKKALLDAGFKLMAQTDESLHFDGVGLLDLLLAKRPLSQSMLANASALTGYGIKVVSDEDIIALKIQAYVNNPKREHQDKADIQSLIENNASLDWKKIKAYADLFSQWPEIEKIKNLCEKK